MESNSGFKINFVYAALVPPNKDITENDKTKIESQILKEKTNSLKYLIEIYDKAPNECKYSVQFIKEGNQENYIRKLILAILNTRDESAKKNICDELSNLLSEVTDSRMQNGLFVIIEGEKGNTYRIVLSRFKAEEVLYTKFEQTGFIVDYLTQAFSKRSKHYKSVMYEDVLNDRRFWEGYAIDKQVGTSSAREISDYWIKSFLRSQSSITSVQGTKFLSKILKEIYNKEDDLETKGAIITAVLSLKNFGDKKISLKEFSKNYLPNKLAIKLQAMVNDEIYLNTYFEVDTEVYNDELGSKTTILRNGARVTAPTFLYDQLVQEKEIGNGEVEITLSGYKIDSKIQKQIKMPKNVE